MPKYRVVNYGDKRFTVRAIKRAIDGALGSRGAWMLEPYADLPSHQRHEHRHPRRRAEDVGARDQERLPAGGPRHRRPRQPRGAEHLRGNIHAASREERQGAAVAHRARAAHQRGRHPALRPARRDRVDAGHSRTSDAPVRARAPRPEARGGGRLRLAEADEDRRGHRQRHRRAGRGHRSDSVLLRLGLAPDRRTARCSMPTSG